MTGTVYQLRVVLAGISPMVRRLLVPAETSIAGLYAILQTAFGWSDEHLHRFTIHAVEYGLWRPGSAGFSRDARQVLLAGFGLRPGERFTYEYDLFAGWRHDIRVEPGRGPLAAPPLPGLHRRRPAGAAGGLRQPRGVPGAAAALAASAHRRPDGLAYWHPAQKQRLESRPGNGPVLAHEAFVAVAVRSGR